MKITRNSSPRQTEGFRISRRRSVGRAIPQPKARDGQKKFHGHDQGVVFSPELLQGGVPPDPRRRANNFQLATGERLISSPKKYVEGQKTIHDREEMRGLPPVPFSNGQGATSEVYERYISTATRKWVVSGLLCRWGLQRGPDSTTVQEVTTSRLLHCTNMTQCRCQLDDSPR